MANPEHIEILKQGVEAWNKWRKENPEIKPDLSGIVIKEVLPEQKYFSVSLMEDEKIVLGAILKEIDFSHTNFERANLERANLEKANLERANLEKANLFGANLFWANLIEANLEKANLVKANLVVAKLRVANLEGVNIREANLRGANLFGANLERAYINKTNLSYVNMEKAKIYSVSYKKEPNCIGVRGYESDTISPLLKKIIKDQDFLREFKIKNPRAYWLWKITCNCGRSFSLWAFWSVLLALIFAYIFTYRLGANHFEIRHLPFNFETMAYYSVVTFTTLGFGDVIPKTQVAAYWVMAEVILGYIMLGGLISIFANKVARQS